MEQFSATLDGNSVTIVDVSIEGRAIYITYLDSENNLCVTKKTRNMGNAPTTIAESAEP